MATVSHYKYHRYDVNGFQPGSEQTLVWGPWNFHDKGIVVTAEPFNLSTAFHALSVTQIRFETRPGPVGGDYYVAATIRNVGQDPMIIWYLSLSVIVP